MLSFNEYYNLYFSDNAKFSDSSANQDDEILEEGFVRSGAVAAYAASSRRSGDEAVRQFNRARDILRRKKANEDESERLDRLEKAFDEMLVGLIHRREQDGYALAANVAAHLLQKPADGRPPKR